MSLTRRRLLSSTATAALAVALGTSRAGALELAVTPPVAESRPTIRTVHGIALNDPYAWLKAENWRQILDDPATLPADIRRHLEAENAYTDLVMSPLRKLSETLAQEIEGRIEKDDTSPFMKYGPFDYATAYVAGAEHIRVLRRDHVDQKVSVVLDFEALAKGQAYFDPGDYIPSPDHRFIAWSADIAGAERFTIRIRDITTGRDLSDRIENADSSVVWARDGRSFLYQPLDAENRTLSIALHRLGTAQKNDRLLKRESDPTYPLSIDRTASERYAIVSATSTDDAEHSIIDLDHPEAPPRLIVKRGTGGLCDIDHDGERFLILTDRDALEFRIVTAPEGDPTPENWRDLVPHDPNRTILLFDLYKNYLVWLERRNALPRIVVRRLSDGHERVINFDLPAYGLTLIGANDFDSDMIRLAMSTPAQPEQTFDCDMTTGKMQLVKEQKIPSGHDPGRYKVERLQAPARDGETVPITLLYRQGMARNGTAPLLLEGYGAYSEGLAATFQSDPFSLVDRGMIYGIAHVRGGDEKGRAWYKAARRDRRNNSFNDYLDVASFLIDQRYTRKGAIVGIGGSAGGTLMGVAANRRPELFAAILAEVPFVDIVNTLLDAELPLTPSDYAEWGNPAASRSELEVLLSYSPYDNVQVQSYPAIFAVGGLTDSRVTYWEPAKWVAKLRAANRGTAPILLRTEMSAGHMGEPGRYGGKELTSLLYAFALHTTGLS